MEPKAKLDRQGYDDHHGKEAELPAAHPAGHALLASLRLHVDWDLDGAETAYRKAVELSPRSAWALNRSIVYSGRV